VFEDEPQRAPRRASARDYNQAYRDVEDGYGEERGRSAGPWLLLVFLLLAAAAAGAGVWYYQTKVKTQNAATATDTVPVVEAPEQPAKTAAETPTEPAAAGTEIPAASNRKQIYDRIVGDQEIQGNQMVPTEEAPVVPQAQPPGGAVMTDPAAAPAATDDTVPLPLPPPPGDTAPGGSDTQGTLTMPPATNNASVEATSAVPEPQSSTTAIEETIPASATASAKPASTIEPPPPAAPAAASQSAQSEQLADTLEIKAEGEEGIEKIEEVPAKPAAKKVVTKAKAKAKPKTAAPEQEVSAGEPLVLVPPAGGEAANGAPGTSITEPAPKKKRTLLDLLRGERSETQTQPAAPPAQQIASIEPDQQVGSLPDPKPAPAPKRVEAPAAPSSGGGGFVAQIASFRSQAEANREYGRLKAKHPGIVGGLPPSISQATVAGSTRYRLGIGPLASKAEASQLCNSLVAAGERDCIVRAQ
jgi:cell division protein FtsN